jgi:hypothetical protein
MKDVCWLEAGWKRNATATPTCNRLHANDLLVIPCRSTSGSTAILCAGDGSTLAPSRGGSILLLTVLGLGTEDFDMTSPDLPPLRLPSRIPAATLGPIAGREVKPGAM